MGVEMWGCMVGSEGLRNGVAQSSGVVQCVCEATQARSAAQGAGARVGFPSPHWLHCEARRFSLYCEARGRGCSARCVAVAAVGVWSAMHW